MDPSHSFTKLRAAASSFSSRRSVGEGRVGGKKGGIQNEREWTRQGESNTVGTLQCATQCATQCAVKDIE
jgi:hypothetical protein